MLNFKEFRIKKSKSIQEKVYQILFDLITDIPDSLLTKNEDAEARVQRLIKQASFKAATVSTTLSIPAGITGIITSIPDIATVWRIQAQLVSDIAATYGKIAFLSREAMVWCLFRHSASQLLRDIAVRTGSRLVVQKLSFAALNKLLQKIGIQLSTKFIGRMALRAIPTLGAVGNGAYTYYDTTEVGKTADTYFKALIDLEKPVLVENTIEHPEDAEHKCSEPSFCENEPPKKADDTAV